MTERMGDEQLDREIQGFLAWQAEDVAGAPSATAMATRISDRAGIGTGLRVAPQLIWVTLASLAIVALLGALAIGAGQQPPAPLQEPLVPVLQPPAPAVQPPAPVQQPSAPQLAARYEAVFLRLEVVDRSQVVLAVGVDDEGRERQIARLPGAWATYDIGDGGSMYLSPVGAVSTTGLLTIASDRGDSRLMMHWEIFDLHQPQMEPLVLPGVPQFIEHLRDKPYFAVDGRGGAFWGPQERLAILWYDCPSSCEVDLQLDFVEGRTGATTTVDVQGTVLPFWASDGSGVFVGDDPTDPRRVLRPDGSIVEALVADAVPSCRTRDGSGAELIIEDGGLTRLFPGGRREVLSSSGGADYACLAPDDSAIVYKVAIGEGRGPATAARPFTELIVPGADSPYRVEGNFAGWMEVAP